MHMGHFLLRAHPQPCRKMRVLSAALLSPTWRATGLCRRPVRRPIVQVLCTRTARERIMDEGRFSVSAASLYNRIGTAAAPILIDVRRRPAFDDDEWIDRKSTRLNSSHRCISYAVFCL